MIKQEDVTIIIPHLGKTKEQMFSLDQCFESLLESGFPEKNIIFAFNDFEVEVVVNQEVCLPNKPISSVLYLTKQGQCKAVNAAAATVNTPWIFVTNDDMIYPKGWFEKLVVDRERGRFSIDIEHFDGCVSPILVEPRQGAPTFITYFCGGAGGDFDARKFNDFCSTYTGVGVRTGFNLPFLIKKELWDMVGGYDVNYDPWGSNSDSDLEYKLKLAGVQPLQNTNCPVYHFSQTSGTFEPRNRPAWEENWQYFIEKWGFPRTDDGIWEATFEIPTVEQGRKFKPWWENKYGN